MNPYIVPAFTITISLVAAVISYFNFRLNKTLNIKNQLFNEKLKKYVELSRGIAEYITLLDIAGSKMNKVGSPEITKEILNEMADKIDAASLSIQYLIVESHMLVPERIIKLMTDFAEHQNTSIPLNHQKDMVNVYWNHDVKTREMADDLIKAFREDLNVDKLNINLGILRRVTMSFRGKRSMCLAGGRVQQMLFQRFKVSY